MVCVSDGYILNIELNGFSSISIICLYYDLLKQLAKAIVVVLWYATISYSESFHGDMGVRNHVIRVSTREFLLLEIGSEIIPEFKFIIMY